MLNDIRCSRSFLSCQLVPLGAVYRVSQTDVERASRLMTCRIIFALSS